MRFAEEDYRYLLMLANLFGWNPVAGLDYYLSIPPPDIIPSSVARHLAETLNRIVPTLPERRGPINVPLTQEGVSFMDLRNYFGGERKGAIEEFIRPLQTRGFDGSQKSATLSFKKGFLLDRGSGTVDGNLVPLRRLAGATDCSGRISRKQNE
jgi:hypothetical protein